MSVCVFLFSVFYPVGVVLFFHEGKLRGQRLASLCKMHVHMLSSEAEHSEAEPAALLSMSGHMVGVLAW